MTTETLARSDRVLHRSVGDAVIATWQGRDDFDLLEGPAAVAWRLLSEPTDEPGLIESLAEIYEVSPEEIREQVREMLEDWERRGLLSREGTR